MILPLEKQVCSLGLAKKIQKLGITQESLYSYGKYLKSKGYGLDLTENWEDTGEPFVYYAFTVSEFWELFPIFKEDKEIYTGKDDNGYFCGIMGEIRFDTLIYANTLANAMAKMLIYLIKNKLLEV